jgi:hypothetical protein
LANITKTPQRDKWLHNRPRRRFDGWQQRW